MLPKSSIPVIPHTLESATAVLALAAAWFEHKARICPNCRGLGDIPETWHAHRIRNHPPRVGSMIGVGFIWKDCSGCKEFRDLVSSCRGQSQ